jgi:hypothetical protein
LNPHVAKLRPAFIARRAITVKMRKGRPTLRLELCIAPSQKHQAIELTLDSIERAKDMRTRILGVVRNAETAEQYNKIIASIAQAYADTLMGDDIVKPDGASAETIETESVTRGEDASRVVGISDAIAHREGLAGEAGGESGRSRVESDQ